MHLDLSFKHNTINVKKILPILLGLILFFGIGSFAFAQIAPPFGGGLSSRVAGSVGELYLTVSGYASPYASISLYINNIFVRGGTANDKGEFYISDVLIRDGLTGFCLKTVDFRHVGESESCFKTPPAKESIDKKQIFLPPTLALSKTDIAEGETTVAYGYTMPGADVVLRLDNGKTYNLKADKNGYFRLELKGLKAGKYSIYATATYKSFVSSSPVKKLSVHVLGWWEQFLKFLLDLFNKLLKIFTSWSLGILWLVIPIIILIIILIIKIWKEKFVSIFSVFPRMVRFVYFLIPRKRKLHHAWWVGY